jgi:pSer/pThr/pTyr-binding forkhead associated (FHA) protein
MARAELSRLCALTAIGALVGFFVGLVPTLMKQAWIRVALGKNEGKEYLIAKPVTVIGRSELADIGLFGDSQIAPTHAVIESHAAEKRHRLRHIATGRGGRPGSFAPTVVNGQTVESELWLTDGDTIRIAGRTLQFREKSTYRAPAAEGEEAEKKEKKARNKKETAAEPKPGGEKAATAASSEPPAAQRPSLTPPPEILDQMGLPPEPASPAERPVKARSADSERAAAPRESRKRTPSRRIEGPLEPLPRESYAGVGRNGSGPAHDEDEEIPPRRDDEVRRNKWLGAAPKPSKTLEGAPEPLHTIGGGAAPGGVGRRLICITGPYNGQAFPLDHLASTIGRSSLCDIPLPADTSISRRHARITYTSGRHILFDYGSSHGVFVNGQKVDGSHPLAPGDIVKIGDTRMQYE